MSIASFNVFKEPLHRGTNLIEASAGTGKTYTIAMLILRFIVEREFSIEQLLVVTFTKAATEELRLRIRARLIEALTIMTNDEVVGDPQLITWLDALDIPKEEIIKRLRLALLDIDRAAIFTIHGMCQRLLSEFPLDGGQQFELELMADTSAMMQSIMDDFWRCEIYQRPKEEVAPLRWKYPTPDKLYASVKGIGWNHQIYPEAEGLDGALSHLAAIYNRLQAEWKASSEQLYVTMSEMVEAKQFLKPYCDSFSDSWHMLDRFCRGEIGDIPDQATLQILSIELLQSKKGLMKKFYAEAESIEFPLLDNYIDALEKLQIELRLKVIGWLASEYDKRMESASLLSFDSLIIRVGELLGDKHSEQLKLAIQDKYEVALIDEFQDTDQTQWRIFSQLFGGEHGKHYLYLIGDPKQAIYKFRGADIFSYFEAQKEATHKYTLESNWRSAPQLVESVNSLFASNASPFLFDKLEFHAVNAAKKLEDGHITSNGEVTPPMVLWQLPESEQASGFWTAGKGESAIMDEVVGEISRLLANDLTSDSTSKIMTSSGEQNIVPGDIAILVRNHRQAFSFQNQLATLGIPSIHSGSSNIFSSAEAEGLLLLLVAVANPGDLNSLKNMLTLPWCGLDGQAINTILQDEMLLSERFNHLHRYHLQWANGGVMAMISSLTDELLIHNIARLQNPERILTNINHLAELLQREVDEASLGVHKTVAWLQGEILQTSSASDASMSEQQLRLESDAAALKIITMHSAKGLEFPIVFAPYLWQRSNFIQKEENQISCHEDGALVTDIGSKDFESRKAKAIKEELAEELRLLYVALTRAKYRCYLPWADARTKGTPNRSALSYLLFSSGGDEWLESLGAVDYASQQQRLNDLALENPQQFEYRELSDADDGEVRLNQRPQVQKMSARKFSRKLDRRWQMSSYSALAHLSASHGLHQSPELPADKTQEGKEMVVDVALESDLPRGAHFGNVLHELLELIPFADLAAGKMNSELRDRIMQRYGLELDSPNQFDQFDQLLQCVVITPLSEEDSNFTLANIAPSSTLKEMPFYFSIQQINTREINRILQDDRAVSSLHEIALEGYLTGFIDLIFEYDGRYYVLDYKSNYLDGYHHAALEQAMHQHNYGLQYWLYSVVLHRYLKGRVANYNYADHFGGALYLFARGMDPAQPASGIYSARPDETLLTELDKVLGG